MWLLVTPITALGPIIDFVKNWTYGNMPKPSLDTDMLKY